MDWLTPEQYLHELNVALQAHPGYRPGMRFVLHPDKGGFDWEPLGVLYPLNEVSSSVRKRYRVEFWHQGRASRRSNRGE